MNKADKISNHGKFILVLDRENKINTKEISTVNKKESECASHVIFNKVIKGRQGLSKNFTDTLYFYPV